MKVGVAGYGRIARHYFEAARATQAFAIVALFDIHEDAFKAVAPGLAAYTDFDRFLADPSVEAVIVATPTATHFDVASQAIGAGKPLLLEKPAALSRSDFDALRQSAADRHVPVVCLFHYACASEVTAAASILRGANRHVAWHSTFYDPYNTSLDGEAFSLVDSWVDSGINQLSVFFNVWPDAKLALNHAALTPPAPPRAGTVAASAEFSFVAGDTRGMAVFETNWSAGMSRKSTRVHLSNPSMAVEMDHSAEAVAVSKDGFVEKTSHATGRSHLTNHYAQLLPQAIGLIRQGTSNWELAERIHGPLFEVREAAGLRSEEQLKGGQV
jgi:predicted dehydrogenase